MESKQVLYMGPWFDTEYLKYFNKDTTFILIDTQPRSQWDYTLNDLCMINQYSIDKDEYIKNLLIRYNEHKFIPIRYYHFMEGYTISTIKENKRTEYLKTKHTNFIDPTLIVFEHIETKQIIKYYLSTNIKYNMISELQQDIYDCDTLYVKGYYPTKIMLDYISNNMTYFYGGNNSCFYIDYDDPDQLETIIYELSITNKKYFNKYYLITNKETYIECTDINDLINKWKTLSY